MTGGSPTSPGTLVGMRTNGPLPGWPTASCETSPNTFTKAASTHPVIPDGGTICNQSALSLRPTTETTVPPEMVPRMA